MMHWGTLGHVTNGKVTERQLGYAGLGNKRWSEVLCEAGGLPWIALASLYSSNLSFKAAADASLTWVVVLKRRSPRQHEFPKKATLSIRRAWMVRLRMLNLISSALLGHTQWCEHRRKPCVTVRARMWLWQGKCSLSSYISLSLLLSFKANSAFLR